MKILYYGGTMIQQCEYTGRCYISDYSRWFNSLRSAKHSITKRKGELALCIKLNQEELKT